jgi:Kef-type K+ transport system membrane component KefB
LSNIEFIIFLLLLLMVVPDVCRRLGRPALLFPAYILFGLLVEPFASSGVKLLLHEAGLVGFLLLLFQVGLEIDLPPLRELVSTLRFVIPWVLLQYPFIFAVAQLTGLQPRESLFACGALTGVSVGMIFPVWKQYTHLSEDTRQTIMRLLIVLESLCIVLLAVETPALDNGWSWKVPLRLASVAVVIFLVARFATQLTGLFDTVLQRATLWRTHLLVLLVLAICALGDRLGLSSTKTAFFLGLFMNRTEHDGRSIEEHIAPVSQRFLIPIFFVSLGLRVQWSHLISLAGLTALGAAGLLLGIRQIMHKRWFTLGNDPTAFLLLCPNLTVVALAASSLLHLDSQSSAAVWLLLTGLFMTMISAISLPRLSPAPAEAKAE